MNILLTSVGRRSYLVEYFKKALRGRGLVHVANSSAKSPAFLVADRSVVTPLIYDETYIQFLLDYCKMNSIKAIIPLFDVDLPVLANHKAEFEKIGTTLIVSKPSSVEICNDKWKTFCFLSQKHILTPRTFLSLSEAELAVKQGEIRFPLMVKPRWGMGSIAVYEAENVNELRVFYEKVKRNILQTYLKYESMENFDESVLIQEKLEGQEYGLDVINDLNGNHVNTVVKMKYAMRSGETDCAVTVQDTDMKCLGRRLSDSLQHIGNLDVDVFKNSGGIYVLEMNARFGGGYPFSHMAGVDLPRAIIAWLMNDKVDVTVLTEKFDIMSQKDINIVKL